MSEKFQGKYRSDTFRAQWWDYGWEGAYFVTICAHEMEWFFGRVENKCMQLSPAGEIAHSIWHHIPNQFSDVALDAFVVMPNHVHGIVRILPEKTYKSTSAINTNDGNGGITRDKNPMFHRNLSRVIRWYKGRCAFEIRKINPAFQWHTRFHDRIIRNETEYQNVVDYINNNPEKWML
jgi:REP element-mobilizing transposase RayT